MKHHFFLFLLIGGCLVFLALVPPLWAGAWNQAQEIGGPPPNLPTPGMSIDNEASGHSSFPGSSYEPPQPPSPEEIEARRRAREEARLRREQRRQEAKRRERRKQREEEERRQPAWPQGLPQPRPLTPSPRQPAAANLIPPTTNVPANAAGKTLRDCVLRAEALRKKASLNSDEQKLLRELQLAIRDLWVKGTALVGLSLDERARMVMAIATIIDDLGSKVGTVTRDTIQSWRNWKQKRLEDSMRAAEDPFARFSTEKGIAAVELMGGEIADISLPEEIAEKYDTFLGIGKIAVAIGEKDRPGAVREFVDLLIGRLEMPQATLAVEGGRLYADLGFCALNRFMKDAMGAVGADFNPKEFWKTFYEDLSFGQKCVYKWIGGPNVE